MNLTSKQWISIVIAILGVLMISQAQLTDLFGATVAKTIQSASGLLNMILGSALAVITGTVAPDVAARQLVQQPAGQDAVVREVLKMDGVEKIDVNKKANQTLAAIAVDPTVDKIAPTPEAVQAVTKTAEEAKP